MSSSMRQDILNLPVFRADFLAAYFFNHPFLQVVFLQKRVFYLYAADHTNDFFSEHHKQNSPR